jgi:hypothetical protein
MPSANRSSFSDGWSRKWNSCRRSPIRRKPTGALYRAANLAADLLVRRASTPFLKAATVVARACESKRMIDEDRPNQVRPTRRAKNGILSDQPSQPVRATQTGERRGFSDGFPGEYLALPYRPPFRYLETSHNPWRSNHSSRCADDGKMGGSSGVKPCGTRPAVRLPR